MKEIIVSEAIRNKLPALVLGCIECDVVILEENTELWQEIEMACEGVANSAELSEVGSHPAIKASRLAYRACGKDPARYRLSADCG